MADHLEDTGSKKEEHQLKLGWRAVAWVGAIVLLLFGMYWSVTRWLAPSLNEQSSLTVAEVCPQIDTNLISAVVDSSQGKREVCGLDIRDRNLSTLTLGISIIPGLVLLEASDNEIKILPDHIFHMTGLRELYLRNNSLQTIPDAISQLSKLEILDLQGNPLPPQEIERVKNLLPADTKILF